MSPLLDAAGVAELLHCSVRTVEDQARAGALPAVKFGEGWVFPVEALLRAVNRIAENQALLRAAPAMPLAVKRPLVRRGRPNLALLA